MKTKFYNAAECGTVMTAEADMPFVPSEGMQVCPTAAGDYFTVDDVYWHLDRPDMLEVYLTVDLLLGKEYLTSIGWREESCPPR